MSDTPTTVGRYVIDKLLGRGSMGVVYKAHDPEIDRSVAIKLVRLDLLESGHRDDYLARFRREVQAAGRCMHTNIIAIYDFGSHEGNPFFAMEYVDAPPLDEAFPRHVGLGSYGAAPIVLQLLDALSCAHELGIVHRDIKPSNMLLTAEGVVKVMDFGISHISTSHLTQIGSVMGTPRYMSPEQFRGDPVDARSDIFSTGAVLHELLTGKPPISGKSFEEVMVKLLHDGLELEPADILMPEPMRQVVAKALARLPEDRFESADAMTAAIHRAMAELEAPPEDPAQNPRTVYRAPTPSLPPSIPAPPTQSAAKSPATTTMSRRKASATASGLSGQSDPGLGDRAVLSTIERRLAEHIGPLAGRLVQSALKGADTVESLCQMVATHIEQPTERESFLREVHSQLAGAATVGGSTRTGATAFGQTTGIPGTVLLSTEELDQVQRELTHYLGPLAKILVKRAAPSAISVADLRDKLVNHLEQPDDRAAFLAGAPIDED